MAQQGLEIRWGWLVGGGGPGQRGRRPEGWLVPGAGRDSEVDARRRGWCGPNGEVGAERLEEAEGALFGWLF